MCDMRFASSITRLQACGAGCFYRRVLALFEPTFILRTTVTNRGSQITFSVIQLSVLIHKWRANARDTEETRTYCIWQDLCLLPPLWVYGQYCHFMFIQSHLIVL